MSSLQQSYSVQQHSVQSLREYRINSNVPKVYVEILEQPSPYGARFRYKCEGRSAGCIRGVNSTETAKTYVTIKVHGYRGKAAVIVSTVSVDGSPFLPHPHNLVGKDCEEGVCQKRITSSDMTCSFPNIGIQCVTRKGVKESLEKREALQVDPFGTGFYHSLEPKKINLNALRLCFQVFLPDSTGNLTFPLAPVISEPVFDNKTVSYLNIARLSHYSAPMTGGQDMILLCDPVKKDDIEICFYEERESDREIIWFANGKFSSQDVHRKVAISFKTPAYKNPYFQQKVNCFIQLREPKNGAVGEPVAFALMPIEKESEVMYLNHNKFQSVRFARGVPLSNLLSETNGSQYEDYHMEISDEEFDRFEPIYRNEHLKENLTPPVDYAQAFASTAVVESRIVSSNTYKNADNIYAASPASIESHEACTDNRLVNQSNTDATTNSNNSDVNLSGMTIDSVTEITALFRVGLISYKSLNERLYRITI